MRPWDSKQEERELALDYSRLSSKNLSFFNYTSYLGSFSHQKYVSIENIFIYKGSVMDRECNDLHSGMW